MTHKREIQGIVVTKAGEKTATIVVERRVMHPRYHKTVKRFKKYKWSATMTWFVSTFLQICFNEFIKVAAV